MIGIRELLAKASPAEVLLELHAAGGLKRRYPELAALDIQDRHSHRHKNNFFHSVQVLKQAMAMEGAQADPILRVAALLHDIGKPATRRIEKNGDASFTAHETVGAAQARKLLKASGEYSKDEIAQVVELIANHMRSFGFTEDLWTDSAVRRFQADLSSERQLERLLILFKADVTSKHQAKRDAIARKVDTLARRVREVQALDARAALRPALDGHALMEEFNLKPGPELGRLMKFLNSDEGVSLSRDEALHAVRSMLQE